MKRSDIVSAIIGIVTPLAGDGAPPVREETELTAQLALDSLKVMDLIVAVEDRFDISIPINALADVRTVGDFATLVQNSADGGE
jgi:acyl carrier protein